MLLPHGLVGVVVTWGGESAWLLLLLEVLLNQTRVLEVGLGHDVLRQLKEKKMLLLPLLLVPTWLFLVHSLYVFCRNRYQGKRPTVLLITLTLMNFLGNTSEKLLHQQMMFNTHACISKQQAQFF